MKLNINCLKHALLAFLCCAFIIFPSLSAIFPLPNRHPLSISNLPSSFASRFGRPQAQKPAELDDEYRSNLERVLKAAVMADNTVIVTTLNQAWASEGSLIDLFLESFRVGNGTARLLDHLIIVALDQKAYDRCLQVHSLCYELRTDGVDFSAEKVFMTADYLRMMWRRVRFLREVLEEGYNVLFTDADILWFRDPLPLLSAEDDFQIACDYYKGDPKSLRNRANGGFTFARSNRRTIQFYRYWYMAREVFPGKHDQDVFNKIKRDDALVELGLQWRFLDTKHVSGFCEPSRDVEAVYTVHANCCYGLVSKLDDLRLILDDWRRFTSMAVDGRREHAFAWSAPKTCLLSLRTLH